jgi:hypothetical protein
MHKEQGVPACAATCTVARNSNVLLQRAIHWGFPALAGLTTVTPILTPQGP